jgi:Protein of unknown function (DUF2806)
MESILEKINALSTGKLSEFSTVAKNILATATFFLVEQSERGSEAIDRIQFNQAKRKSVTILLEEEAKSLAETRKTIRKKLIDATPEDRIQLRSNLEYCEKDIEQLNTIVGAFIFLPEFKNKDSNNRGNTIEENNLEIRISDHWIDKFNQFSRSRNEEWRQVLLSRALAAEAVNPGSISSRALWLIGTLEKEKFEAFGVILSIFSMSANNYFVPHIAPESITILSSDNGKNIVIGELIFILDGTGLIGLRPSQIFIEKDEEFIFGYDRLDYSIKCNSEFSIDVLQLSNIGDSIARLYERNSNPVGKQILDEWLTSLDSNQYKISKQYSENNNLVIECMGAE